MKKGDFIAIGIVLIAAALIFLSIYLFSSPSVTVKITEDNEVVYEGEISTDKKITLKNNTVVIENGEVFMEKSNCKNQICVKHKKIKRSGESIICLPNKVIVETK